MYGTVMEFLRTAFGLSIVQWKSAVTRASRCSACARVGRAPVHPLIQAQQPPQPTPTRRPAARASGVGVARVAYVTVVLAATRVATTELALYACYVLRRTCRRRMVQQKRGGYATVGGDGSDDDEQGDRPSIRSVRDGDGHALQLEQHAVRTS